MYEYNKLSPLDFEELVRDIIQVKYDVFVESFTTGRDGGIDLRYSKNKDIDVIIQCKRYTSGYFNLYTRLKKERQTIIDKGFQKYILATSVGLTPKNKKDIIKLLSPLKIKTDDILGKNDLNNIISNNKKIELKHFKLWYSSTNVLQRILNNRIHVQSQIEKELILDKIKYYVQNNSYNESLNILKENNFVIISGIPGIGKTTLARIIIFNLLMDSEYQFINISNNIDDGFDLFADNEKQIFLFDDFLGRNFLKSSFTFQSENGIVQFINKVKRSKNKILIFTTREYVLKQALIEYEELNHNISNIDKYVIALEDYTSLIKAKILYNHLFFNDVPVNHIKSLFDNNTIVKIINHTSYSPRMIDDITKQNNWEKINPKSFGTNFINSLDKPFQIWKTAYQFHISKLSQIILKLIYSTGTAILYSDLYNVTEKYVTVEESITENFDETEFDKSLNELENSFILTKSDDYRILAVEFQNPSIKDFLYHYLDKSNALLKILANSLFSNQYYSSFAYESQPKTNYTSYNFIEFTQKTNTNPFAGYLSKQESVLSRKNEDNKIRWVKHSSSVPKKLYLLLNRGKSNCKIREYVLKELGILINNMDSVYFYDSFHLYSLIKEFRDNIEINIREFLEDLGKNPYYKIFLDQFVKFKEIYPEEFNDYFEANRNEILNSVVKSEIDSINNSNMKSRRESLQEIQNEYNIDLNDTISELKEDVSEFEESNQELIKSKMDSKHNPMDNLFNETEIEQMFSTLLEEDLEKESTIEVEG